MIPSVNYDMLTCYTNIDESHLEHVPSRSRPGKYEWSLHVVCFTPSSITP